MRPGIEKTFMKLTKHLNTFAGSTKNMEHHFELPVTYKDEEMTFTGRLVTFAYEYKFFVQVQGVEIVYEQDDEQHLRAVTYEHAADKQVDPGLIAAIALKLEEQRAALSI